MYGDHLAATGLVGITVFGASVDGFWTGMLCITVGAVGLAVQRLIPRKEV